MQPLTRRTVDCTAEAARMYSLRRTPNIDRINIKVHFFALFKERFLETCI